MLTDTSYYEYFSYLICGTLSQYALVTPGYTLYTFHMFRPRIRLSCSVSSKLMATEDCLNRTFFFTGSKIRGLESSTAFSPFLSPCGSYWGDFQFDNGHETYCEVHKAIRGRILNSRDVKSTEKINDSEICLCIEP
jgi:hypothetical protein